MTYKVICPACGKKVSRWYIFLEPKVYHRCRGCSVEFRTNWMGAVFVIGIEMLWFALEELHVLSPVAAIGLIAATCVLAIWLLPYFSPTQRRE